MLEKLNQPVNPDFLAGYKTRIASLLMLIALINRIEISELELQEMIDLLIINIDIVLASAGIIYGTGFKIYRMFKKKD